MVEKMRRHSSYFLLIFGPMIVCTNIICHLRVEFAFLSRASGKAKTSLVALAYCEHPREDARSGVWVKQHLQTSNGYVFSL